jgi:hypothetical protein
MFNRVLAEVIHVEGIVLNTQAMPQPFGRMHSVDLINDLIKGDGFNLIKGDANHYIDFAVFFLICRQPTGDKIRAHSQYPRSLPGPSPSPRTRRVADARHPPNIFYFFSKTRPKPSPVG